MQRMEREESRSIGFTKVALGKFIDQNYEVMYFTRYDVRRIILAYKLNVPWTLCELRSWNANFRFLVFYERNPTWLCLVVCSLIENSASYFSC